MNYDIYNVVDAIFLNNERTMCEVTLHDNIQKADKVFICSTDEDDQLWAYVQKFFTIDQIGKNTDTLNQRQEEALRKYAIDTGLAQGFLYDPEALNPNDRLVLEHFFNLPEGQAGQDLLFELKLRIFDMQEVIDTEDDDLKQRLRECESPIEAMWIAGQFLGLNE